MSFVCCNWFVTYQTLFRYYLFENKNPSSRAWRRRRKPGGLLHTHLLYAYYSSTWNNRAILSPTILLEILGMDGTGCHNSYDLAWIPLTKSNIILWGCAWSRGRQFYSMFLCFCEFMLTGRSIFLTYPSRMSLASPHTFIVLAVFPLVAITILFVAFFQFSTRSGRWG